jgi:hypothetical protein
MNTYNGCLSVSSITGRMPKIMFECTVILNLNFLGHSKKKKPLISDVTHLSIMLR